MDAPRQFATTRWSVVLRAGGASPQEAHAALEQLCQDYWYPLYAFVRRKGYSAEDAADLTQDFFAKLLAQEFAQGLTPTGGRFRSFLLTALDRFLISQWEKQRTQKRGGGKPLASLEALIAERGEAGYLSEASDGNTPEVLYERAWARTVLHRVLARIEAECREREDTRFEVLRPFLGTADDAPRTADAAAALSLSLPAFKSLLHRFRQRYREVLLDEVRQTVSQPGEVAEELRRLVQALRAS